MLTKLKTSKTQSLEQNRISQDEKRENVNHEEIREKIENQLTKINHNIYLCEFLLSGGKGTSNFLAKLGLNFKDEK